jgi:ankyrin repeat protein
MSNWDEYKKTFNVEEDVISLARNGDAIKLNDFLIANPDTDINQKNNKGYSPLMISVYHGHYDGTVLLLDRGANPNSTDFSGNTVLMGAAFKGDLGLISLLINHGAQKHLKNHAGMTAEEWAGAFGRTDVVSLYVFKRIKTKVEV